MGGAQAGPPGPGAKGWMSNYKTRICKNWQMGTCNYGNKCTFAHGSPSIVYAPLNY